MQDRYKILKNKAKIFLLGFPYGILAKVILVEEYGEGKYSIWDRIRYRLLTKNSLKG